jgi:iron(III) transport system ATP-binding protein
MTVRDNIGFGLRERKLATSNIQQKTNEVLELVNLSHLADRMPNQLSGGQQQRIALARTLVVEPDVLLLDEPLSNLDASLRVQMRRELLLLQRKLGLTTIFVTHDQEEANTTCDRMAVLENGIIQQVGSPQELYDNPTNLFVAKFLGTANILTGSIETNGRNTRFVTTTGETLNLPTAAQSGTQLVLRPQNIEIQKTSGKGTLKARVIHREFLGSQIRYLVNAAGTELVVDHSHTPDGVWFENGTNIHLRPNTSGATVL